MAKIWRVYEGREPTRGGPWVELPLRDAIVIFNLKPKDFISNLSEPPRFGYGDRDFFIAGYKHIVVEIESDEIGKNETSKEKWKPGFYRSNVKIADAFGRLIEQALIAELGRDNVVRVEHEPTTDSQGRDAVMITVVITPGSTKKLKNDAALNALVRLNERLREMGEERTPVIQYATEAELKQDVGP